MRKLLLAVLASVTIACVDLGGPAPEPPFPGSYPINPVPAKYYTYWMEVEKCSGVMPRPMTVAFYQSDSANFGPVTNGAGYYQPGADRITYGFITVNDPGSIRHEMLHAHGVHGHPVEYRKLCGSLLNGW